MTKSEQAQADVSALLRARLTFLWIRTMEEHRTNVALIDACARAKLAPLYWDCNLGLHSMDTDAKGKPLPVGPGARLADPNQLFAYISDTVDPAAYILLDAHVWLKDPFVQRKAIDLAQQLEGVPSAASRAIIVVSPSNEVPTELKGHVTMVEWPMPEREDIAAVLDDIAAVNKIELDDEKKARIVDAASGLLIKDAADFFAKSIVLTKDVDPKLVVTEKTKAINSVPGLQLFQPDPRGLAGIGGYDRLISFAVEMGERLSQAARDFGCERARGCLLFGVSGTGKSLAAKVFPTAWGLPLVRMDPGAFKSKYVGESEGNARNAFRIIEAVSPVVVWIDELDKVMAGAAGPQGDGGVSSDFLATILNFMQETTAQVVFIGTGNDPTVITNAMPEFMRKGRWDEVFFLDLPNSVERAQILAVTMAKYNRADMLSAGDIAKVARECEGFTGAEIAALVPTAVFAAFKGGKRAVLAEDLIKAASVTVPLSKSAAETVEGLRKWAKGRAALASSPEVTKAAERGRKLDI